MWLEPNARPGRLEDPTPSSQLVTLSGQHEDDEQSALDSLRAASGVTGHSNEGIVVWRSLDADQRALVEEMMKRMRLEHDEHMETLTETFGRMKAREEQRLTEQTAGRSGISERSESNAQSQEGLDAACAHKGDAFLDAVAAIEPIQRADADRLAKEFAAIHSVANSAEETTTGSIQAEIQSVKEKLVDAKSENTNEKDVAKARLASVQALLDSSRRDFTRRDKEELAMAREKDAQGDDVSTARVIEDLLSTQADDNSALWNSLTEKKLELLNLQQQHKKETDSLKGMLLAAQNNTRGVSEGRQVRCQDKGCKKSKFHSMASTLPSIDEGLDPDEIGSQAASSITCDVSSDGIGPGESVANLTDFEDAGILVSQTQRLAEVESGLDADAMLDLRFSQAVLQRDEDMTKQALADSNPVHMQNIDTTRTEHLDKINHLETALENLRAAKSLDEAVREQRLKDLDLTHSKNLEEIQQQLALVEEQKRVAGLRLTDTRRELNNQEERNAALDAKLEAMHEDTAKSAPQIQALEEERNVLENKLECQRVLFDAQLEYANSRLSQETARLETERTELLKQIELNKQLDVAMSHMGEQLKLLRIDGKANQKPAAAGPSQGDVCEDAPGAGTSWHSFFKLLRCPSRFIQDRDSEHRCLWQYVTSTTGYVALLCQGYKLEITDATKAACLLWGRDGLWASSLTSLFAYREQTDRFMDKLLNCSQNEACERIGVMSILTNGRSREYSVFCTRGNLGNEVSFIFIFEPEVNDEASVIGAGSASASSSISDDIQCCDSVSNVDRAYG